MIVGAKFLAALAAGSQQRLRNLAIRVALALAAALSAAIGLGFATCALFEAWRLQYGIINAAIGLSAIYFILAGILYLCSGRIGLAPRAAPVSAPAAGLAGDVEALKALGAQAGANSQGAALALGVELAKQLTPLQLALLSLLSGFVAGRRL